MSLNVTCPGCKKRFTVSEKFAGQKGPCPSCKAVIQIPSLGDQVVVHAPESAAPKDRTGRSITAPILRAETTFSPSVAVLIGVAVVGTFVAALLIGRSYPGGNVPAAWQMLAAFLLAPPLVLAGYSFLRSDELEPYRGRELWLRVLVCGAAYAFLWGVYGWLQLSLGIDFDVYQLIYVVPPLVLVGGFAAFASLEIDYTTGLLHYGFYLMVTVALRLVAGMQAF